MGVGEGGCFHVPVSIKKIKETQRIVQNVMRLTV